MKKENERMSTDAKGIVIDGVEYFNQSQAAKMVGLTVLTFKKRVEEFGIEHIKRPSGKILFSKDSLEKATENGWFKKWFL